MLFCCKKPIIIMHSDAIQSPVPVGKQMWQRKGIPGYYKPVSWSFLCKCLNKIITAAWMSCYYTPAMTKSDLVVLFEFFFLYSSLPLRTSEDERGNRDREVLGQSLGAAG